jgi:multidrug efflux pump subunit AcrA (membrane-fusion protein)
VPERAAAEVAIGQQVRFTVDGLDDTEREGLVARLGAVVDRQYRTRLVEATVANADGSLLPGAFCRAKVVVAPAEQALTVPRRAVSIFAGVARVFTIGGAAGQPPRAEGRVVQLGRDLGDRWEIVGGLAAGIEIVAEPDDLRHGDRVTVER